MHREAACVSCGVTCAVVWHGVSHIRRIYIFNYVSPLLNLVKSAAVLHCVVAIVRSSQTGGLIFSTCLNTFHVSLLYAYSGSSRAKVPIKVMLFVNMMHDDISYRLLIELNILYAFKRRKWFKFMKEGTVKRLRNLLTTIDYVYCNMNVES